MRSLGRFRQARRKLNGRSLSPQPPDVTSQVASKVSSAGGITNFLVTTGHPLDGLGLVVIYSNPSLPETTIAVFDGDGLVDGLDPDCPAVVLPPGFTIDPATPGVIPPPAPGRR